MAAQQNVDEYKISTMHCGENSFAIVHKVHSFFLFYSENEKRIRFLYFTFENKIVFRSQIWKGKDGIYTDLYHTTIIY